MKNDNIKNAQNYYNLSPSLKLGLEYLENTDFSTIENGKYVILEDKVFAIVKEYMSKPKAEGKFEAHKNFIDIQYIVDGEEQIGVGDIDNFSNATEYNIEKDIVFLAPKSENVQNFISLKANEFAIFEPQDAHMPSIAIETPSFVRKVVVKVHV